LIAKQKPRQAEEECARYDEKRDLRYIKHVEIPHAQTFFSRMVMAQALTMR
jgi:hypothetical protein